MYEIPAIRFASLNAKHRIMAVSFREDFLEMEEEYEEKWNNEY